ncbi:S41 family peptidase [Salinimicrobium xinjiangense]|uniref:S41 family peptidase n=1 Tax=Salinimicrobium xinjiangense TaxID=438596 RepID=UPI000411DB79|nr:S41 family peptidase [Salinimicrobium xinjiangense]
MKKIFFLLLSFMVFSSGKAQQFDTTAYKAAYKVHFEKTAFGDSLTTDTKIAGLSTAWAEAKYNFANFDLIPAVNWDSIYNAYIPKVIDSRDRKEYYTLLKEFYTHLNDGHSLIVPPKELWNEFMASLPIRAQLIEDRVVITGLQSNKPEYELLQPRSIINKINGIPAKEYAEKYVAPYVSASTAHDLTARLYSYFLTHGSLKEPLVLEMETPKGKKITHSFIRESRDQLFPASSGFSYKPINNSTGLLTINTFNDSDVVKFYDSLFQTPLPRNLIIDIRNNGGGNGNNGFELIGYLTSEGFPMSMQVMRRYKPVQRAWGGEPDVLEVGNYTWKPYKTPVFTGNVVVLAGPDTYSAAEDFLSAFKNLKRGTVVGQATGGSTGQPLMFQLPFGGLGIVCAKRDVLPDGTEFVGVGISPDIEVKPTLKAFLSGKDEAFEAALKMLR